MKKTPIILAFILITGAIFVAQAQTTQTGSIKDVDFNNFSFSSAFGNSANQKLTLSNGKFEEDGMLYELFGQPVYGDLNGDKSEEAVVEIKGSGGSYRTFEVQAYTFQKGAAKLLAHFTELVPLKDYRKYYGKGDLHYAGINPPKIKNGHVFIEALMDGSFACPKYTAVFDYKLIGNKFVLSGKPTRNNFKCNG